MRAIGQDAAALVQAPCACIPAVWLLATAHQIGNRLRRVGMFLEGRAWLRPGRCGRDKARPSRPSTPFPSFDLRPFPDFPMPQSGLSNLPGTATGRAAGMATHEACFNAAAFPTQIRIALPRQFPKFGAVAPSAKSLFHQVNCVPTSLATRAWSFPAATVRFSIHHEDCMAGEVLSHPFTSLRTKSEFVIIILEFSRSMEDKRADFIDRHSGLFWYTPESSRHSISDELLSGNQELLLARAEKVCIVKTNQGGTCRNRIGRSLSARSSSFPAADAAAQ